jgi:hypothetical protein
MLYAHATRTMRATLLVLVVNTRRQLVPQYGCSSNLFPSPRSPNPPTPQFPDRIMAVQNVSGGPTVSGAGTTGGHGTYSNTGNPSFPSELLNSGAMGGLASAMGGFDPSMGALFRGMHGLGGVPGVLGGAGPGAGVDSNAVATLAAAMLQGGGAAELMAQHIQAQQAQHSQQAQQTQQSSNGMRANKS